MARTIAVDFDGVLHPYSEGWVGYVPSDEPPIVGAEDFLMWCKEQQYEIVIFSTRADKAEGKRGIEDWLIKYDLAGYVFEVTHVKVIAFAYVDDRAVPFVGDWSTVRDGVQILAKG